jgi:hypothetical protein
MTPVALVAFCEALSATTVSQFLQGVTWLVPAVQTVHILAIAVVFASAGLLDLRLLDLAARSQSAGGMARRLLPAVWCGLAVLLGSGAVLILVEPMRALPNPAFQLKMLLLLLAVVLTGVLKASLRDDYNRPSVRLTAAVSLLLWIVVIVAGRWIAYIDPGPV